MIVTTEESTLITRSGKAAVHTCILRFAKDSFVVRAYVDLLSGSYELMNICGNRDFRFGGKNTLPILELLVEATNYIGTKEEYVLSPATTKSSNVLSDGIRDFMGNPD